MDSKNITRRFSLEQDFMDYVVDDVLYGYMRAISTAMPSENGKWKEYLLVKDYRAHKKAILTLCNCSERTLLRHFEKLIEKKLIEKGEYEGEDCYFFKYDEQGEYQIITKDMVRFLANVGNPNILRIYIYLAHKQQIFGDYIFTKKELLMSMGYKESAKNNTILLQMIQDILITLTHNDILKIYEDRKIINGKSQPVYKLVGVSALPPDKLKEITQSF